MIRVDLRALVGKLNDPCRRALEGAAGLCLSKTHYEVEIEHWLLRLSEASGSDVVQLYCHYEINRDRVIQDLMRALDRLRTGNPQGPALSPRLPKLIRDAWVLASVQYDVPKVRSGFLLLALFADDDTAGMLREISPGFGGVSAELMAKEMMHVIAGSPEDEGPAAQAGGAATVAAAPVSAVVSGKPMDAVGVSITVVNPSEPRHRQLPAVHSGRAQAIAALFDLLARPEGPAASNLNPAVAHMREWLCADAAAVLTAGIGGELLFRCVSWAAPWVSEGASDTEPRDGVPLAVIPSDPHSEYAGAEAIVKSVARALVGRFASGAAIGAPLGTPKVRRDAPGWIVVLFVRPPEADTIDSVVGLLGHLAWVVDHIPGRSDPPLQTRVETMGSTPEAYDPSTAHSHVHVMVAPMGTASGARPTQPDAGAGSEIPIAESPDVVHDTPVDERPPPHERVHAQLELDSPLDLQLVEAARTPPRLDENVQFTVYRPRRLAPARWYPLLAFAHLAERHPDAPADAPDPIEEVARQARQMLGEQAAVFTDSTEDSRQGIPREGDLSFVLDLPQLTVNPKQCSFRWLEDVHREEFRVRAGGELAGKTIRGRLTVLLGTIIVADIPLTMHVTSEAWAGNELQKSHAQPYRRIFPSYSHLDVEVVRQCERYAGALGDRYLRDTIELRAGELWDERLTDLIRDADVFQLFWSRNSMNSPFVRQEWERALALHRPNFVRPTYWEEPLPTDPSRDIPPPSLRALHFQRLEYVPPSAERIRSADTCETPAPAARRADEPVHSDECNRRPKPSVQHVLDRVRKPRVHITYDIETGGALELKELPFVVGVLADLSGNREEPLRKVKDREFIEIDRDNFDVVLKKLAPRLAYHVDNTLMDDDCGLSIELRFNSLEEFEPNHVANQIESMRTLLQTRQRLSSLLAKAVGNDNLVETLPEIINDTELLQQLSTTVELSEHGTPPARVPLPAEPKRVEGDLEATLNARIGHIDASLSHQLSVIMHAPEFERLESAWRGLRYLVEQSETSPMLKLRVMNVSKDNLIQDLEDAAEGRASGLFKRLNDDVYGTAGHVPFGALIGDYEFGNTPTDLFLLEEIARVAAVACVPFVAAVSPQMFGLKSFTELADSPDLSRIFDTVGYDRWRLFRDTSQSCFVGLTLPRILIRLPFGPDTIPLEAFNFREASDGKGGSTGLWGNAAYAFGARLTAAFAKDGWCAAILGVEGGGLVADLPVQTVHTDDGGIVREGPTEIAITDRYEAELSHLGFIPLLHRKGTNDSVFYSANSCRRLKYDRDDDESTRVEVELSARLENLIVASRFAHYLKVITRDKRGSFGSRVECQDFLNQWISQYVSIDTPASNELRARKPLREGQVDVVDVPESPGVCIANARIRPHLLFDDLKISLRIAVELLWRTAVEGRTSEVDEDATQLERKDR